MIVKCIVHRRALLRASWYPEAVTTFRQRTSLLILGALGADYEHSVSDHFIRKLQRVSCDLGGSMLPAWLVEALRSRMTQVIQNSQLSNQFNV